MNHGDSKEDQQPMKKPIEGDSVTERVDYDRRPTEQQSSERGREVRQASGCWRFINVIYLNSLTRVLIKDTIIIRFCCPINLIVYITYFITIYTVSTAMICVLILI